MRSASARTKPIGASPGSSVGARRPPALLSGPDRGGRNAQGDPAARLQVHGESRSGTGASRPARRVLVVDDEPSIRLLCRVNLAAAGLEVVEAVDGQSALELARTEKPDIVLLDVMMPGVDGWSVAVALAADERTRSLPIVFLTARAERADRERGHDLGGVGYLLKPFDPVMLGSLVENTLDRIDRGEREQLRREMFGAP